MLGTSGFAHLDHTSKRSCSKIYTVPAQNPSDSARGLFGNSSSSTTMQISFSEQSYIEFDTGKLVQSTENLNTTANVENPFSDSNFTSSLLTTNNYTVNTQLTDDLTVGQPLPSPALPPVQQTEAPYCHQEVAKPQILLKNSFFVIETNTCDECKGKFEVMR